MTSIDELRRRYEGPAVATVVGSIDECEFAIGGDPDDDRVFIWVVRGGEIVWSKCFAYPWDDEPVVPVQPGDVIVSYHDHTCAGMSCINLPADETMWRCYCLEREASDGQVHYIGQVA